MNTKKFAFRNIALSCILILNLLSGYAAANAPTSLDPEKTIDLSAYERSGLLPGYLPVNDHPNSLALLPPPPAPGSAEFALDEDVARRTFAVRDTPRFAQALLDYNMTFPLAAGTFSCTLNAPITEQDTPTLYKLLRRSLTDAGISTVSAKNHYKRQRPFVLNKEPICAPETKEKLENDGSYPSGHTTVGWTWALILAEISPEQTDAILARAKAFGENRNVCNHHWYSDVEWGRTMGAATVASLHTSPEFLADLETAKAELAAVRAKGLAPTRNCTAEAAALLIKPY
ncbi:MAG TPA: phosphatase PAP2 family protein [Negativicutes bacterium]|nr:phosphatase PAP2 family protein [Negativicutes bacterium]